MLRTFVVKWREEPDGERETRVLTSTLEAAQKYIQKNYASVFMGFISVELEPLRTTICEHCGSVLKRNYSGDPHTKREPV